MVFEFATSILQAKGMQDPEIQNILSDPVMRQVRIETALSPFSLDPQSKCKIEDSAW